MRVSSASQGGVARQRVGPTSLGIAPRACTILTKLFLLLLLLLLLLLKSLLGIPFASEKRAPRMQATFLHTIYLL